MHINELTLLIQRAGTEGIATVPTTSFEPIQPLPDVAEAPRNYLAGYRPRWLEKILGGTVKSLHKG